MKLRIFLAALAALSTSVVNAQLTVLSINLDQGAGSAPAVHTQAGTLISSDTGFVAVGTFSISDAQLMEYWSSGNVTAILEAWVQHGNAGTVNGLGGGLDGMFSVAPDAFTPTSGVGNKPVYTVITTTSSPLDPNAEFLIFKHSAVFPVVEPVAVDNFTVIMTPANGTLLVGEFGNYTAQGIGGALPAEAGYNTVVIPEPSTWALLGLGALAGFVAFRRRR